MTNEQGKEPLITRLPTEQTSAQNAATPNGRNSSPDLSVASLRGKQPVLDGRSLSIGQFVVALLPITTLAGVAVLWSFFGKIPIEVDGRAVLIAPRSNVEFQTISSGPILKIQVKPGDTVKVGQVLAILDTPELRADLESKQQKLIQLRNENTAITAIQNQRTRLKQNTLQTQRQAVPDQFESIQAQVTANQRQRQAYVQRIAQLSSINKLIAARLKAYNKLSAEGAIAPLNVNFVQIIQAEQNNQNEITSLKAKIEDIDSTMKALQAKAIDLKAQTIDLANQSSQLSLDDLEANTQRRNDITDLEREIADSRVKIQTESRVVSTREGRVIDIAVNRGQVVTTGTTLGTIQVNPSKNQTAGLAFFKVGDADRIAPGMEMEITPGIQSRQQIGAIIAEVTSVSAATVTPQQISSIVGNDQLAKELLVDTPSVLVEAKLRLNPKTISGYEWTLGQGPPQKIPESATATARVTVEERSLVSYITPLLRQLTGIY